MDLGYTAHPRVIVIDEPEYTASYHIADLGNGREMTFVHLDVFYLGPSILRQLQERWNAWRHFCPAVLFCMGDEDDDKFARFVSRFGFQYLHDVTCTDDISRRLFVNFGPTSERPD